MKKSEKQAINQHAEQNGTQKDRKANKDGCQHINPLDWAASP
jgi:hypothetical protein